MSAVRFPRGHDPVGARGSRLPTRAEIRSLFGPTVGPDLDILENEYGRVSVALPAALVDHFRELAPCLRLKGLERGFRISKLSIYPKRDA